MMLTLDYYCNQMDNRFDATADQIGDCRIHTPLVSETATAVGRYMIVVLKRVGRVIANIKYPTNEQPKRTLPGTP